MSISECERRVRFQATRAPPAGPDAEPKARRMDKLNGLEVSAG